MAHQLTVCTFCGVGCGIYLEAGDNRISGAYPSMSHPTNQGKICLRGWNVHEVASSPDRLKAPLLRKDGQLVEVSWEEALEYVARRLREIQTRHGPDAIGFLNSPRCSNEEAYLLQKLARAVVGTNNVDHGTGVYCNNSIHVLLEMLSVPATTNGVGELQQSAVIIVDGVDLGVQLPTIGGRVIQAKLAGARLIVIDARRHRVAEHADYFLQLRPGTDIWLYGAMAKVILDRGLMDTAFIKTHCRDFEGFYESALEFDLLKASDVCGVAPELIEGAALAYATAKPGALLYSTGIEARGKASIRAMVNLVLLTGNLGKPGGGLFALTEQNNLQGVCDMGMLPDRLPGYYPLGDPERRRHLEKLWRCPALSSRPGLGARQLLDDSGAEKVKALWLCRYDPVTTATFCAAAEALKKIDLVVVQHLFMTETARFAHVVLPVVAFGEEQVSFTSTDRRIQVATQIIQPPEGPLPAWAQLTRVARALGAGWDYASSAEVMDEIGQAVPTYGGASHENLRRDYGRQWPCTKDKPMGTDYLFADGVADPPFKFAAVVLPLIESEANDIYPYALIFGNSLYYWNQNVLIKHSETLRREFRVLLLDYPQGFVEINADDAQKLGIRDGARIRLVAPGGAALATARVTREMRGGTIYVPFFVREVERQILGPAPAAEGVLSQPVYVQLLKA